MKFKSRLEEIDPRYYTPCEQKGSLERIEYKATNYDGRVMDKYAYVYLPCGYDPEKEYDILYLIHGGGESAEKYLYLGGEENQLKNAVDHLIAEKTIKPLIICTPSPYPDNKVVTSSGDNASFVRHFHNELCDELMPIVESRYHTFAKSNDPEGLKEARRHRAVMGWSMGSFTTWCVFLSRIGWFDRFGFLSCYYGLIEDPLTKEWADEHASEIVEKVKAQNVTKKDFDIFSATGTLDHAGDKLSLEMAALMAYPDLFDFYGEEKNVAYYMWPKGEHHTYWRQTYIINALKQFFGY